MSVERICTVVVLPAPLGPSSANTLPSAISRSMPSRTTLSPKALRSPTTCTAATRAHTVAGHRAGSRSERRMVMSPNELRARTSTRLLSRLRPARALRVRCDTLPKCVLRSSHAATPSRIPMSTLPSAVCATTVPRLHLAEAHIAIRRLGNDGGVRVVDVDRAVGGDHPQVSRDVADPGVAVGPLDHGGAVDGADPHRAGSGA